MDRIPYINGNGCLDGGCMVDHGNINECDYGGATAGAGTVPDCRVMDGVMKKLILAGAFILTVASIKWVGVNYVTQNAGFFYLMMVMPTFLFFGFAMLLTND